MVEASNQKLNVNVDSDVSTRKGVHADIVIAETNGADTRLDFVLLERSGGPAAGDGGVSAVLASRIFMSRDNVIALRDMLNEHTSTW